MGAGAGRIDAAVAAGRRITLCARKRWIVPSSRFHAISPRTAPSSTMRSSAKYSMKKFTLVLHALAVERVQHRVAGAVGRGAGALGDALAVVRRHAAEGALVDAPVRRARERHAEMLELIDRFRRVLAQVFDRVLVAQPVRALDGVVHVPAPVVLAHVAQRRGDAALRRDRVAAGREDLGDAGGLEAARGAFQRGAQAGAAGAHDDDVERMIGDRISAHQTGPAMRTRAKRVLAPMASATARTSSMRKILPPSLCT